MQYRRQFLLSSLTLICLVFSGCSAPKVQSLRDTTSPESSAVVVTTSIIEITKNGFKPTSITIPPGETLIIKNSDDAVHQIASDPHPTHDVLPDLYSSSIYKGESYTYRFLKHGTYGLHLEDNPSVLATVTVK